MSSLEVEALRALYRGRDAAACSVLRSQLADLGEALAAQFADLQREFTPERAERLLINLAGATAHVRRLVAEDEADGR